MTQRELQDTLGVAMSRLKSNLEGNKFSEKELRTIQTMCSVAKQMVCNADIMIRASKLTGNRDACNDLIK